MDVVWFRAIWSQVSKEYPIDIRSLPALILANLKLTCLFQRAQAPLRISFGHPDLKCQRRNGWPSNAIVVCVVCQRQKDKKVARFLSGIPPNGVSCLNAHRSHEVGPLHKILCGVTSDITFRRMPGQTPSTPSGPGRPQLASRKFDFGSRIGNRKAPFLRWLGQNR